MLYRHNRQDPKEEVSGNHQASNRTDRASDCLHDNVVRLSPSLILDFDDEDRFVVAVEHSKENNEVDGVICQRPLRSDVEGELASETVCHRARGSDFWAPSALHGHA